MKTKIYIYLLCAFCILIAIFFVGRNSYRENIFDLLPFQDSVIEDYIEVSGKFSHNRQIYFEVSSLGDSKVVLDFLSHELSEIAGVKVHSGDINLAACLKEYALILPSVLEESDLPDLKKIASEEEISKRIAFFRKKMFGLDAAMYKEIMLGDTIGLTEIVQKKLRDISDSSSLKKGLSNLKNAEEQKLLLIAEGDFDATDSEKSRALMSKIEDKLSIVKSKFPSSQIKYIGAYVISKENSEIAQSDSVFCISLTIILMLILCFFAFSTKRFALITLIPSLLGTSIAFIILSLFLSEISRLAIAFATIAIGVGIDYAIHILHSIDNRRSARELLKPIIVAAGTTIIAFAIMCIFGGRGFFQIGMFGAVAVLFSALASFVFLPLLAHKKAGVSTHDNFRFLSEGILFLCEKFSRCIIAIIFILTATSLFFVKDLKFDGDISNLSASTKQTAEFKKDILANWADVLSSKKIIIRGKSVSDMLVENEKIEKFLSEKKIPFRSVSSFLKSEASESENISRWDAFWTPQKIQETHDSLARALKSNGFSPKLAEGFLKNPKRGAFDIFSYKGKGSLPFSSIFYRSADEYFLQINIELPSDVSAKNFYFEVKAVSASASYIDMDFLNAYISKSAMSWLLKFSLISAVCVLLYLFIILRDFRKATYIFFAVSIGLIWCFALMSIFGVKINMVNSIFVIFAVCIAQDYAVFLLSSKKDEIAGVMSAVFISAFTTLIAFGTFSFASHPVLNGLGKAAVLSIGCILSACIFLIPILKKNAKI